jgi:hypothetical protein
MPALMCRPDTGNHDDRDQDATERNLTSVLDIFNHEMTAVLPGPSDEPSGEDVVVGRNSRRWLPRAGRCRGSCLLRSAARS